MAQGTQIPLNLGYVHKQEYDTSVFYQIDDGKMIGVSVSVVF